MERWEQLFKFYGKNQMATEYKNYLNKYKNVKK